MEQVIYLDVFFSINFLMNLLIIIVTGKILVKPIYIYKATISASIGAVYACVVAMRPLNNNIIQFLLTYIVIALIMILVSYKPISINDGIKTIVILYISTFILNGVVNTMSNFSDSTVIVTILSIVVLTLSISTLISNKNSKNNIRIVTIWFKGNVVTVAALIDTGNSLTEPISHKPVSVLEAKYIKQLVENKNAENKFKIIPYNSVGKQGGVMKGIQVDSIQIDDNGNILEIKDAIVGSSSDKLSFGDEYNMLLSPSLCRGICKERGAI